MVALEQYQFAIPDHCISAGWCKGLLLDTLVEKEVHRPEGIKLRFSNYGSATTAKQLRLSNHGSATTAQQSRLSNHGSATKLGSRFSNYASATKTNSRFSNYGSATKTHPLWQVHAQSHLPRHIKIPPPLASTCTVSSYTKSQNPTPSGKYMHSLILHIISKSHPLWQVHAQSHLPRHLKIPPPLASTCASLILHIISKSHPLWQVHAPVSSSTSYQNPTPSGKYMHSLILHIISESHPLWQVHAQSHLAHHIKIPPPLASTCTVSSYTSYQNPTPSGKFEGYVRKPFENRT